MHCGAGSEPTSDTASALGQKFYSDRASPHPLRNNERCAVAGEWIEDDVTELRKLGDHCGSQRLTEVNVLDGTRCAFCNEVRERRPNLGPHVSVTRVHSARFRCPDPAGRPAPGTVYLESWTP